MLKYLITGRYNSGARVFRRADGDHGSVTP
jgi:hypothetical protein